MAVGLVTSVGDMGLTAAAGFAMAGGTVCSSTMGLVDARGGTLCTSTMGLVDARGGRKKHIEKPQR